LAVLCKDLNQLIKSKKWIEETLKMKIYKKLVVVHKFFKPDDTENLTTATIEILLASFEANSATLNLNEDSLHFDYFVDSKPTKFQVIN
jgi:hypothetical protein